MPLSIELKNISKTFAHRNWRTVFTGSPPSVVNALVDVSIEVQAGEVLALLGPNGAGKTTLIKILTTLVSPDSGQALVAGYDVRKQASRIREKVGLVTTNDRSFYWRLSGLQNLQFFAALYGLRKQIGKERIAQLLEFVGLSHKASEPFMSYSSGQQQRLAIARALLNDPEIMFFDEPTTSLDPSGTAKLIDFTRTELVDKQQKTIIWCTHNLHEAEIVADRVAILNQGKFVITGTMSEIKAEIGRPESYVLEVNCKDNALLKDLAGVNSIQKVNNGNSIVEVAGSGADMPQIIAELSSRGVAVLSCQRQQVTLNDVYQSLVEKQLAN